MSITAVPITEVSAIQEKSGFIYWKIFDKNKRGSEIDVQDKLIPLQDSISLLQNRLNAFIGDYVIVCLYSSLEFGKGKSQPQIREMLVKLNSHTLNNQPSSTGINGIPFEKYLADRDALMELKMQNALLQKELNEPKSTGFLGAIGEAAQQKVPELIDFGIKVGTIILDRISSKMENKQPTTTNEPVAGTNNEQLPDYIIALRNLAEIESDYIGIINKIAQLAKDHPEQYAMYKSMILK